MKNLLTISQIANTGCAAALSIGRWNACEAWTQCDLSEDAEHIGLRFYDRNSRRSMMHTNGIRWALAWDEGGTADGSEKFIRLSVSGIFEMPIQDLEQLIIGQLLEATSA